MRTSILFAIYEGVNNFLGIVSWIVLAYCILSWIVRPDSKLFRIVSRFAQPILAPFRPIARKLMDAGFRVDVSPLLVFLAIRIVRSLLARLLFRFM